MKRIDVFIFIGQCLSLGTSNELLELVSSAIISQKINWNLFVEMASNHLVLPTLYSRFEKSGLISLLPVELANHLEMVYQLNLSRNRKIIDQIDRINRLFNEKGIQPIYLKGAGNLLDNLYENLGDRIIGDIDLLVSDEDFLLAANVLKDQGYEHSYPFYEDQRSVTKHFPRLVHPTEIADVEIHRSPVNVKLSASFNFALIDSEKKMLPLYSAAFVPSDKHKAILNFMHAFMGTEAQSLNSISYRNCYDLFLLSRRINIREAFTTLPDYKNEATIYFDFTNRYLNINPSSKCSSGLKIYITKHELFLRSRFIYSLYWVFIYLLYRFYTGYVKNLIGFFVNKQVRLSVVRRITTPSWYISHIKSYTSGFRNNLTRS